MANSYTISIGDKFNRLTVISSAESRIISGKKARFFKFRCDCGIEKEIKLASVMSGVTKSCGCYNIEKSKVITQPMHGTRIYRIYYGITQRCNNSNNLKFKDYGGRGIKCEWKNFNEFYEDMKESYNEKLEIDRIDNNGNYCKENCKWSTRSQQNRNTRLTVFYKGISTRDWCDKLGLNFKTVDARIHKLGWDIGKALQLTN